MRSRERSLRTAILVVLTACASAVPCRAQVLVRRFPPPAASSFETFSSSATHAAVAENPTPGEVPVSMGVGAAIGGAVGLVATLVYAANSPRHSEGPPAGIVGVYVVPIGAGVGAIVGYLVGAMRGDVRPPSLP